MADITESFPTHLIETIRKNNDNFRVLKRNPYEHIDSGYSFPYTLINEQNAQCQIVGDEISVVFLDTETTGLTSEDVIIELSMVKAGYSPSARCFTCVYGVYDEFEDPKKPIPEKAKQITGITDEDVKDKKIQEADVLDMLKDNPIIVGLNARFDYGMFNRRFKHIDSIKKLRWFCSFNEIKWRALFPTFYSQKLEFIMAELGYFYSSHRAIYDCLALLCLFQVVKPCMDVCLKNINEVRYRLIFNNVDNIADYGKMTDKGFLYNGKNATSPYVKYVRIFLTEDEAQCCRRELLDSFRENDGLYFVPEKVIRYDQSLRDSYFENRCVVQLYDATTKYS